MSRTVLVAGANGALGREIVRLLVERGDHVRALGRDAGRMAALKSNGVELAVADARDPAQLGAPMRGVDAVISALGASTIPGLSGWRGFGAVDLPLNKNLIDAAAAAGAKKMVYVSVHHSPDMRGGAYVGAHERVVDHLRASSLDWAAVRPTGFFSAIGSFVDMARRGRLPSFGSGETKSNPIHDADLAAVCVDALGGTEREIACGGPDVITRRQMSEMAFEAIGQTPRIVSLPAWVLKMNGVLMRPFHPRFAQLMSFFADLATHDLVAPVRGQRTLRAHFKERAAATS